MNRFTAPLLALCLGLPFITAMPVRAESWTAGTRVIVEKAGAGHRAIVLRAEPARIFVAYEGADETHDEWVEPHRLRLARPPATPAPEAPATDAAAETAPEVPVPEPLPHSLELPRPPRGAAVADAWLEQIPRQNADEPVRFNTARLAVPRFTLGEIAGIPTVRGPQRVVLLHSQGRVRGFAAIESGVSLYGRDERAGFIRLGGLDLSVFESHAPEHLIAADLNQDGETDLVVVGGPVLQVYFGTATGAPIPALQPYRAKEPLGEVAAGRFFSGALPTGLAVVEGFNTIRLLRVAQSGITPAEESFTVRFDRITRLVAGDFDGDGFTDLAAAAEHRGRSAGAWMYFNQRGALRPFLWPVGGRDDFARDLAVADLDRDGRDDLIMTDSDVERGDRVRIVFGSAGRAGWEDPWELIASEYGLGLGTASIVVADFNRDGRPDIGLGGRNGLRVHLGADYRRFSRNPVWPQLVPGGDFPEQRAFVAGDFDGDGATDLLGYTPVFATGYNLVFNATPTSPEGVHVPAPRHRRLATQAGSTVARVESPAAGEPALSPDSPPQLRHLASRAEPYGQWRYRLVVEVATLHHGVVQALEAFCKYEGADQPLQVQPASARREGDHQWVVEITLPRGRNYEFTLIARDDKGRTSEPLRVTVSP